MEARVGDFMTKEPPIVDADANLVDVALKFYDTPTRSFPVFKEGELVGMISRIECVESVVGFALMKERSMIMPQKNSCLSALLTFILFMPAVQAETPAVEKTEYGDYQDWRYWAFHIGWKRNLCGPSSATMPLLKPGGQVKPIPGRMG